MHTQGPWKKSEIRHGGRHQLVIAQGQSKGFICDVQAPLNGAEIDESTREANAQLIASAPDLLAAAQALLNRIDNITTEDFSKGGEREEREALRAVIAKATAG